MVNLFFGMNTLKGCCVFILNYSEHTRPDYAVGSMWS